MQYIFLQQSGKLAPDSGGDFWVLAGVALPADRWRHLQMRLHGLHRSFRRGGFDPTTSYLDANSLLHPRKAEAAWRRALCKGLERIVVALEARFFLVTIDKRTTDRPAHPRWLLPLSYQYLMKPICQSLNEANDLGTLVIAPGREDEAQVIQQMQAESLFGQNGRACPLVASPVIQRPAAACGLQVADFVATVARRYHENVFPKLYRKEILYGYDALINSHYQGFVKPNTYQSDAIDDKGYRIRGYIYLWRRENNHGHQRRREDSASDEPGSADRLVAASASGHDDMD